jgi:hypothetical protein
MQLFTFHGPFGQTCQLKDSYCLHHSTVIYIIINLSVKIHLNEGGEIFGENGFLAVATVATNKLILIYMCSVRN